MGLGYIFVYNKTEDRWVFNKFLDKSNLYDYYSTKHIRRYLNMFE